MTLCKWFYAIKMEWSKKINRNHAICCSPLQVDGTKDTAMIVCSSGTSGISKGLTLFINTNFHINKMCGF